MRIQRNTILLSTLVALSLMAVPATGQAQSSSAEGWRSIAEERLKAIYSRREFRTKPFRAEWLPDSSGYVVQERSPQSNRAETVVYDVQTGTRIDKPDTEQKKSGDRMVSPDGGRRLEFRDRNLFVRDLKSDQLTQLTR